MKLNKLKNQNMKKNNKSEIELNNQEKLKYYAAFSYIFARPLLKAKIFEYFNYDIKRAFLISEEELMEVCAKYNLNYPKDYIIRRDITDVDECFKKAFLDEDVKILTYEDEKYPPLLKEIPDFPLSLFYKGNIDLLDNQYNLAIVGSRNASSEACITLDNIISCFRKTNLTIVSGLAYGIDAQAHKSAIKNDIKTVAVVGSGLDIIYPKQNKNLFYDIIQKSGVVLSEYPLKTKPMPSNFPQRNRIVVGMSKGTLVAEARLKSGAMISARLTLDYNRELMCIPGNILNPNTEGIYHLIKNGASITTGAQDILNALNWEIKAQDEKTSCDSLNDNQKEIYDILSLEAKTFDEIMQKTNIDVASVMVILTELEIQGLIKQANNKYYKLG